MSRPNENVYPNMGSSLLNPANSGEDLLSPYTIPKPQDRNKNDLHKLLIDERIRCDAHKTNYQVLKEEHKLLQEENTRLQFELNKNKTSGAESNENLQELVHDLRSQLAIKSRELEEVRSQGLNPQRLELIKAEITKELEGPMKEHVRNMDAEVEKYRSGYNKLRYDYEFVKSEIEHQKADHKRMLDELTLRYQSQISALQQEKDNLIKIQKSSNSDVDLQKVQTLQRHKTQLEQRIKNLLEENKEIRKQKESALSEADQIQRTQAKDISQLQGNLKSIESEKRSSDMQCERLHKELQSNSEHNTRLTQQIQDLNKECSALRNIADEESHKHKMQTTSHKMELMKIQGDLEREKEEMQNKIRKLETEVELLKSSAANHAKEIEDFERESTRRIQKAKEEEWSKNHSLQTEKMDLEAKCNELERHLVEEKNERASEREQTDEKIRTFESNENMLHSEVAQLRSQIDHESKVSRLLEKEQKENSTLRQRIHDKELELQTIALSKNQVLQDLQRAREVIQSSKQAAEEANKKAEKAELNAEKMIEDQRVYAMEEKHRLQSRATELEHKLKKTVDDSAKKEHKDGKFRHMMVQKLKSMKNKNQLLEAEKERLEIELKAGRHGVSLEEHNRMRRKLNELRKRLREFHRVISISDHANLLDNQTHLPLTSTMRHAFDDLPLSVRFQEPNVTLLDKQTIQADLSQILKRLDDVASRQKEQEEVLTKVANNPAALADDLPEKPLDLNKENISESDQRKYSYSSDSFISDK